MSADCEIVEGIPGPLREEVAGLYHRAFAAKIDPILRARSATPGLLARSLDESRAIVALAGGRALGVAGLNYGGRRLAAPTLGSLTGHFGWLPGLLRYLGLLIYRRSPARGELLMDGIAVAEGARGRGVGGRLLDAVLQRARAEGFERVRLDVVDTNPRARALYERKGFLPTRTRRYPLTRRLFGFAGSTTMVHTLAEGEAPGQR